jgi:hypothetical protein
LAHELNSFNADVAAVVPNKMANPAYFARDQKENTQLKCFFLGIWSFVAAVMLSLADILGQP